MVRVVLAALENAVFANVNLDIEITARRANVVVSTRSNLDEVAGRLGLDDRALHPIPYPVRLGEPAPMPPNGAPRVTFVGRLEPRKAPEVVLRAAPKVLAAMPDARFTFVGRDATARRSSARTSARNGGPGRAADTRGAGARVVAASR